MKRPRRYLDRLRRYYDPDPRRYHRPYYDPDPDPFPFTIIITTLVLCGLVGGTSIAIQRPAFFDHLLMIFKPDLKDLAEKELQQTREFWRIVLIIVLVLALIAGIMIWYRYREKMKRKKEIEGSIIAP